MVKVRTAAVIIAVVCKPIEACTSRTKGTCKVLSCSSKRGPTSCRSGKCHCKVGFCASADGQRCVERTCPAGHYGPDCAQCLGGATRRRRATACFACSPGYYDSGDNDDCSQCLGGATRRRRATACSQCSPGYYDSSDHDDCSQCLGGATRRRRATACSQCSAGYYNPGDHDDCTQCAHGATRRRRSLMCSRCDVGYYDPGDNDDCIFLNKTCPVNSIKGEQGHCSCQRGHIGSIQWNWTSAKYDGTCSPCNGLQDFADAVDLRKCKTCTMGYFAVPSGMHSHTGCEANVCKLPHDLPAHARVDAKHCPINGTLANRTAPASLCHLKCEHGYMEAAETATPYECQAISSVGVAYQHGYINCTPAPCSNQFCQNGILSGNQVDGCSCACTLGWRGRHCDVQDPCTGVKCADGAICKEVHHGDSYVSECAEAVRSWAATSFIFCLGVFASLVTTPLLVACYVRKKGSCSMWGVEIRALTRFGHFVEELMPLKGDYKAADVEFGETPQTMGSIAEGSSL